MIQMRRRTAYARRSPYENARKKAMGNTYCYLAIVLTVFVICIGCGGEAPRQHYDEAGAFSYDPPNGWQIIEFPGLKYRISRGPSEGEFAPNINVVDEAFTGTLAAYVDGNLKSMEKIFVKMKILAREDFKTQDNEAGQKLVTENEQQGRMLRQIFFFLGTGKRKYVITCTALADGGARLDPVFDKSMVTFRIH
jgi:hypothetical protein